MRTKEETEQLQDELLAWVALGNSAASFAAARGFERSLINQWCYRYNGFEESYTKARIRGTDWYMDKALEVAENSTPETAKADRVRIDTYVRLAGKMNPAKYGDKSNVEVDVKTHVKELVGVDPDTDI